MEQKTLTPSEALRALADGRKLRLPYWVKSYVHLDDKGRIVHVDGGLSTINFFYGFVEYVEPFVLDFDWSCLPAWADRWIAFSYTGCWFCFDNVPFIYGVEWRGTRNSVFINKDYQPKNFTGDWQDSLFENPKYKEGK